MKKLLTIIMICFSLLLISQRSNAQQQYDTETGAKFGGYEYGISFKYFLQTTAAIETNLGLRSHGLVLSGLFEYYHTAFGVKALRFYYGAGVHIGSVGAGTYARFNGEKKDYQTAQQLLGVDGVFGFEYVVPGTQLAISIDANPRAELATGPYFNVEPGLGIRYVW